MIGWSSRMVARLTCRRGRCFVLTRLSYTRLGELTSDQQRKAPPERRAVSPDRCYVSLSTS